MQEDPGSTRDSKQSFSVLDRLLITHPVWLQLSINSDSALYILLREPVGTFLVRKCSSTQRKVLCVRVSGDRTTFAVKECYICEEDSTFALECSALSFPDLCRLVAFYCISRDVLPFPLQLPDAIAQAASHRKLEAISHMGLEFWSTLSPSELQNGPGDLLAPPSTWTSAWTSASTRTSMSTRASQDQIGPPQDMCAMVARGRQGALCFINPLFLQLELTQQAAQGASNKRHRFKRSMRVRVSTESSLNLSGGPRPCSPPPPEPSAGGERMLPSPSPQRQVHAGAGLLKRTPALAPTSMEDEELVPHPPPLSLPDLQEETPLPLEDEPSIEVACLALEGRPAPSLAELDSSSSFSSLEDESEAEEEEQEEEEPDDRPLTRTNSKQRPPLVRSHGHGGLHRMSAAFVCFFAPEKRLARLVEELSRDRRSAFGAMVLDFLQRQREELKTLLMSYPASMSSFSFSASTCSSMSLSPLTSVGLLQGVRRFLSQAKAFLLDSGELEPPIDTLVPENEKDLALEKAMFGCVLKPLKGQLSRGLALLHRLDGSTQRLTATLHRDQEGALERLGVQVGVPDARGVERVRQKLALMQRTHSPIDKVLLLLQVCKCVHKAMGSLHGQEVSPVDFLPALSYLIVQCNRPQLLLEVEYMMELLEPSWLTGEGGYYLTSVYASLCLIQTPELEDLPPGSLPQEALDQLREWGYRRSREAQSQNRQLQSQRCVRVLFQDGERSAVRTLQWRAGESREVLAQLCAATFGVSDPQHYTLYWRSGGEMRALPTQAQPQDLASHSEGGPSLSYLRTDHDFSKMRRLTRGGAVDLGESVCEE